MASKYYDWTHGRVHYHKRGLGEPLLLVHNVYPGASWEEWERNVAELSRKFTVYAIDLLGFGDSDRPRYFYKAETYVALVFDFVREVIQGSTYVAASGLSAAYVAEAVTWGDDWFRKLVLICPRSEPTGLEVPRWFAPVRRFMMTMAPMGAGYETMTGEKEMRDLLLDHLYHAREATPERVERLRKIAARHGSSYPYASLVTGYLDSDIMATLPKLSVPVLLVWGRQARPTPVGHSVRLKAITKDAHLEIIEDAGAWVHNEQSAKVNALIATYLNDKST
jgi:pimeloyl-ACP methyl ester carboxylesterase